jgi:hypothetical protein
MADRGRQAWLRGESPKQQRRREMADARPVRTAVTAGAFFGPTLTFSLRRRHR